MDISKLLSLCYHAERGNKNNPRSNAPRWNEYSIYVNLFITFTIVTLFCYYGCGRENHKASVKTNAKPIQDIAKIPKNSEINPVMPLHIYRSISKKILGGIKNDGMLKKSRKIGILKVGMNCNNSPFCFYSKYNTKIGFQVDLCEKISQILSVKLNIVDLSTEKYRASSIKNIIDTENDISMLMLNDSTYKDNTAIIFSSPYFYSQSTNWLRIVLRKEDKSLKTAVDRIIQHLYDTGTYQQIYKKWFWEYNSNSLHIKKNMLVY